MINTDKKRALFLIPCCSPKVPNGDNPPWMEVHSNQALNKFQFLDNVRLQMITFYSNLEEQEGLEYYTRYDHNPEKKIEKRKKAWGKNLLIPECRTMKAVKRYDKGKLYEKLDSDVKRLLQIREFDNVLIVSALMGIISPTDLIPDYDLMMTDKSPKNRKIWVFWRDTFATNEVKKPLQQMFSKFDYIYCLMSTTTGYVNSVADILSDFESYCIIPQKSGQTNKLRSWGRVLSGAVSRGYNLPDEMRKVAEMYSSEMVKLNASKRITIHQYEYSKRGSTNDRGKEMPLRKHKEIGGMKMSQADEIREYVQRNYIEPARKNGLKQVTIKAGEVAREVTGGTNIPNVNNALRGKKIQEMCGILLIKTGGTSGSTTATYTYEILPEGGDAIKAEPTSAPSMPEHEVVVEKRGIPELIRELAKLKDEGLITKEDFERKKKELLDRL